MGMTVVTVATGGMPVVEAPGGYPVAEGPMGVPVTKVTGIYGWPVTYTGGSGPPNWSSAIFPGSIPITGQTITPDYVIHAYLETITAGALSIDGQTITPVHTSGTGPTVVTAPNGMSWTFPGAVVNGTYWNGDPWVYTATTLPMPTLSTPATGTGATARHGGMINPTFNTLVEASPNPASPYTTGMKQGFDGRASEGSIMTYDETYNAHLSASILSPGDTLVSAESYQPGMTQAQLHTHWSSNDRAIFKMAALTVVNYVPDSDEFRPPYFGTTKTRRRWSELNLGLLPNLTSPFSPKGTTSADWHIDTGSILAAGTAETNLTNAEAMRSASMADLQYWVVPIYGTNTVSYLKPMTQMYWYPRDTGAVHGRLACYVLHNVADRDIFLGRIVQAAIDTYAIATGYSGITPFLCGAGFWASPLWLIRFAGLLFDDASMKNAVSIATGKTDYYGNTISKWGELGRVYYSATAHSQYTPHLPSGYVGSTPLFGDTPFTDVSGGQSSNGTIRDPNGIYDAYRYHSGITVLRSTVGGNSADGTTIQLAAGAGGTPGDADDYYNGKIIVATLDGTKEQSTIIDYVGATRVCTVSPAFSVAPDNNDLYTVYLSTFPNILLSTYIDYPETVVGNIGTYMHYNRSGMGCYMASIIMGDSAFWGGAVGDFNKRWVNDRQMWENWGVIFDYSTTGTTFNVQRDQKCFAGTGNHWMWTLWDAVAAAGVNYTDAITSAALPVTGQTITPAYVPGGTWTTVYDWASDAGGAANATAFNNLTAVTIIPLSDLSAPGGTQIRLTFVGETGTEGAIMSGLYVGNGGGTDAYDFGSTPVQLFQGGSPTITIGTSATVVTDAAAFVKDGTNTLVIAMQFNDAAHDNLRRTATGTAHTNWSKTATEAGLQNKTGYGSGSTASYIAKVELFI